MEMPPTKYDAVQLAGGLDQLTPTLQSPPGLCRRAVNFECATQGGYSRIGGYERFDGRVRPSIAVYTNLECAISGSVSVGDTVTGVTSGATGKVIARDGGSVVITRHSGVLTAGETLTVAGTPQGVINNLSGAVADGLLNATYLNLAADEYRASITSVPGSGPVRGVFYYDGKVHAFRNSADGTKAVLYASTVSGWTEVALHEELAFTNANANVSEGDILYQGGSTATVARVTVNTGSLTSGVNTGRLILISRSGAFAAGAATSTGSGALTLTGAQTAVSFLPGGRFQFELGNFGGSSASRSVYGVDGVNRAFEFDGTYVVPISTGMALDTPNLISIHRQHLFLAFGFSLQFSGIGDPFAWSPVVGAGEIGMMADITNLVVLPGDQSSSSLAVFTKTDTSILYGTSSADFSLTTFAAGSGALRDTAQSLDQVYVLNDFGVSTLAAAQNFGNFSTSALTQNIRPYVSARVPLAAASGVSRSRGQYRVFFNDGSGLYVTLNAGKPMGAMPVEYINPVVCLCEGLDQYGNSTSYFGSTNGFVYEMDIGTSFDGAEVNASMELTFNAAGSHRIRKRYRKASLEVSGGSYISFDVGHTIGYGSSSIPQDANQSYAQYLRSSFWDSFVWDSFVWDGTEITPGEITLNGTAENISFRISSLSDFMEPFTVNTITTHYTPRRGLR